MNNKENRENERNENKPKSSPTKKKVSYTLHRLSSGIFEIRDNGQLCEDFIAKQYKYKELMKREIKNLRKLKNVSNVPRIQQFARNILILHRIPGKDLFEWMKDDNTFSEDEIKYIIRKLIKIIQDIHSHDLIHRDLKPENVMYDDENKDVYLIDFDQKTTPEYTAPEIIQDTNRWGKSVDVWGLGIICYILTAEHPPWQSKKKILEKPYPAIRRVVTVELNDFISKLLEKDWRKRITLEEALKHPWLADGDKKQEKIQNNKRKTKIQMNFKSYNKDIENAQAREIKT